MAKKKKAQIEPVSESQAEEAIEYRPPTYDALRRYGFEQQLGSTAIQLYAGYKGSPKIEIILLSHGWFAIGPPGPNAQPNPKKRAKDGNEFLAHLHAAGYPDKEETKRLDAEQKRKDEEAKQAKEKAELEAKEKKQQQLKNRANA
jgi:hypothetical protein